MRVHGTTVRRQPDERPVTVLRDVWSGTATRRREERTRDVIETTVGELKRHDRFKLGERGREYEVSSVSTDSSDLCRRYVYGTNYDSAILVTTSETKVLAVKMVREVEVACLALTHEGDQPPTMLHDLAKGPKPRGIFCGDCAVAADDAAGF